MIINNNSHTNNKRGPSHFNNTSRMTLEAHEEASWSIDFGLISKVKKVKYFYNAESVL